MALLSPSNKGGGPKELEEALSSPRKPLTSPVPRSAKKMMESPWSNASLSPKKMMRGSKYRREEIRGKSPSKNAASPKLAMREKETDEHRLAQRRKEVAYGKNTLGYERYLREIPKCDRKKSDPRTPDVSQKASKRQFDGIVRAWRRRLHQWDPPKALLLNPLLPSLQGANDEEENDNAKQQNKVPNKTTTHEEDDGLGPAPFEVAVPLHENETSTPLEEQKDIVSPTHALAVVVPPQEPTTLAIDHTNREKLCHDDDDESDDDLL